MPCLQGFVGRNLGEPGLKPTVRVGEAAMREVAAFLLDYDQFAHVPNTVFGRLQRPGSARDAMLKFPMLTRVAL